MRKIVREYIQMSERLGFNLRDIQLRNGHYALHYDAGTIFAAGTPSDNRNRANIAGLMKRLHAT